MMAKNPIRSSKSFIWYTRDVLGTGATSTVYLGRFKKNGDKVAVKVFNNLSFMRPSSVQQREFDVLLKLKHENIVKLIAIEEDQLQKQPVLVMELCTGGSLYSMLEDPENSYGLSEKEFLKVLGDIAAGMKHLRERDIVHRDIKPGNIMRVKSDDGSFIYKLADFGAARELEEDQPYMSLYGTEEYLHPDLYQRAVLRQHTNLAFTARTDLWSTGVTFYHTATGVLPFRPFGGRKNRDIMFHITTKKASGIISAVQRDSPGGEIEWNEKLPQHCHISKGLRPYITSMLAGLMECHMGKMWTFDKLFDHVRMIQEMVVIFVFVPRTSELLKIFVPSNGKFAAFQEQITFHTNIPDKNQLFYFDYDEFVPDNTRHCCDYPKTAAENPMLLFTKSSEDFPALMPTPQPSTKKTSTHFSLENDLALAKMYAAVLYYQRGVLEVIIIKQKLYSLIPKTIQSVFKGKMLSLQRDSKELESVISQTETLLRMKKAFSANWKSLEVNKETLDTVRSRKELEEIEKSLGVMDKSFSEIKKEFQCMQTLLRTSLEENILKRSILLETWANRVKGSDPCTNCVGKFEVYLQDSVQIYQQFRKDRQAKKLSYNEEQIHKMDKDKLGVKCAKAASLLTDHCENKWKKIHFTFKDWWNNESLVYQSQVDHAESSLHSLTGKAQTLKDSVRELIDSMQRSTIHYQKLVHDSFTEAVMDASDATTSMSGMVETKEMGTGSIVTQETHLPEPIPETIDISSKEDLAEVMNVLESVKVIQDNLIEMKGKGEGWIRMTKKQKEVLEKLDKSVQLGIPILQNAKLIGSG